MWAEKCRHLYLRIYCTWASVMAKRIALGNGFNLDGRTVEDLQNLLNRDIPIRALTSP